MLSAGLMCSTPEGIEAAIGAGAILCAFSMTYTEVLQVSLQEREPR